MREQLIDINISQYAKCVAKLSQQNVHQIDIVAKVWIYLSCKITLILKFYEIPYFNVAFSLQSKKISNCM